MFSRRGGIPSLLEREIIGQLILGRTHCAALGSTVVTRRGGWDSVRRGPKETMAQNSIRLLRFGVQEEGHDRAYDWSVLYSGKRKLCRAQILRNNLCLNINRSLGFWLEVNEFASI